MGGVCTMIRRAVFLDRDGVINRAKVINGKPHPPSCLAELEILSDVPEALHALHKADFRLIVVTNQPDVARGAQRRQEVEAIHKALFELLPLDEIRVCYHDDADCCHCRKPKPGLLFEAASMAHLDLTSCFMVGDRYRDIEAGQAAGCKTVFIDYGYDEKQPTTYSIKVKSLGQAAQWICAYQGEREWTQSKI